MRKNSTLVMKFGGKALCDMDHLHRAVKIVIKRKEFFDRIIVVVSAMGQTTDQLMQLAQQVNCNPPKREQDMLLSVGERISMALLAMVFAQEEIEAHSFTGSQAGIITCCSHTDARILDLRIKRLIPYLEEGKIVIVAGFQGVSVKGVSVKGVSVKGDITTLGRGGSDITAVALGVGLGAAIVEFHKDVQGIFENDPHLDAKAKHLPKLSYREAIEIIGRGERQILHPRAVILAEKNHLPLHVLSFSTGERGSLIVQDELKPPSTPVYEDIEEGEMGRP